MKVIIIVSSQTLDFYDASGQCTSFSISTGKNGVGQLYGSEQTPLGQHVICEKIGAGALENTVFVTRKATGEIYSPELAAQFPERDWILTRILRLDGCERGLNKGGEVDTFKRCVYIHGVPDKEPMGVPRSHGCIRMRNQDMMRLFDQVEVGVLVEIKL